MSYEDLLLEADSEGLMVREKEIPGYNGRIYQNRIAIHKDISTQTEKACVLAEELGHHYTTVGDILDQNNSGNRKQEQQARTWAYNKLIGLMGIVDSYQAGCRNATEMAEHLDVTEEFLTDALERYHSKYGRFAQIANYIVYFEPCIAVLEIQN